MLGYGFIGESVVKELQSFGFRVAVYDSDPNGATKAMSNPSIRVVRQRHEAYTDVRVIIGCTGNPSLPEEELREVAPGTLLVNMASTDTEFNAWKLREQGNIVSHHPLVSDMMYLKEYFPLPWRSLYRIDGGETHYYLANGGFPSDFTGKVNPVPVGEIQLTAALLLGAAVQATQAQATGLIDLDATLQKGVIAKYAAMKESET